MKISEAIKFRRSIRQYGGKPVSDDTVTRIIEAGIWAPSGMNNQPWKFRVLKGAEKDALADFTKYGAIIKNAPVAVAVFLDNGAVYNREKDIMAVGACVQNMLLEAHSLGLGTCWLGEIVNKKKEVAARLGTERDAELMAVIMLGYPDEEVTESCRKPLKDFLI